jgi:Protein of unknown function (DUF1566)
MAMNYPQPRFIKLDANGAHLPPDAEGHVAVLDRLPRPDGMHRIWPVADVTKSPTTVDKLEAAAGKIELFGERGLVLADFDELSSLVDRARADPSIDTKFFPSTVATWYASSTPYANNADYVWVQYFLNGGVSIGNRHSEFRGRAVRRVAAGQ